jgi:hypothetical protein
MSSIKLSPAIFCIGEYLLTPYFYKEVNQYCDDQKIPFDMVMYHGSHPDKYDDKDYVYNSHNRDYDDTMIPDHHITRNRCHLSEAVDACVNSYIHFIKINPNYKHYLMCHSMGSIVGLLAATKLIKLKITIRLIFLAPMFGTVMGSYIERFTSFILSGLSLIRVPILSSLIHYFIFKTETKDQLITTYLQKLKLVDPTIITQTLNVTCDTNKISNLLFDLNNSYVESKLIWCFSKDMMIDNSKCIKFAIKHNISLRLDPYSHIPTTGENCTNFSSELIKYVS